MLKSHKDGRRLTTRNANAADITGKSDITSPGEKLLIVLLLPLLLPLLNKYVPIDKRDDISLLFLISFLPFIHQKFHEPRLHQFTSVYLAFWWKLARKCLKGI